MPEEAIKKKITLAKKAVKIILIKADYKVEVASNKTFCINAARRSENRIIAVGIKEIVSCLWFKEQIKNLEKWPNPAPSVTSKEVWIRERGEHNFAIYHYENNRWLNEDFEPVGIFDN